MIPDPVKGVTRRHGSQWVAEKSLGLDGTLLADYITDTNSYRTFGYNNAGNDYELMIRRAARPVGSNLPFMLAYNRTTKAFLTLVRNATDPVLDSLIDGGVSAVAAVGKYVFMAGNTIVPTATSSNLWAAAGNQADAVVWIRGGAYSRTFTVKATKTDNTSVTFSYTTPTSSYPDTLDTSAIPVYAAAPGGGTTTDTESAYIVEEAGPVYRAELSWHAWTPTGLTAKKGGTPMTNVYPGTPTTSTQYRWTTGDRYVTFAAANLGAVDITITYTHVTTVNNPNYTKAVNDKTNKFNSAVTNWIGTAAEATQPENIAESLRLAAVAAGLTTATRQASTVIFDNVKGLVVNDGGDGSLIRGVANEVVSIEQVSDIHKVGKIVKVRARNSAEAFYLQATSKDPSVTSGYTEVTWVEGAGVEHTITSALVYATVSAGSIYVASSATLLAAILPGTHPEYSKSTCGDADSSPLPFFVGKKISYLGVFQDRLMIGANAVIRASKIGDYLNFFRSSVLTAPADDPLEMLSQGSDDDELRHPVIYDRDLVIFGRKRQYAISGRGALTPTSANMAVMSSHANAASIQPLAVGGAIFYAQLGTRASSVHQIQPGQVAESPESYPVSSQINTYLEGNAIELANSPNPTHLFVRTTGKRNSVYCFSYLDMAGQGRVQDAWSRWDFNEDLGPIIGMSQTSDGLLVYRLQTGTKFDASGTDTWVVADLCPMTTGLASYPYLDSIRPWADVEVSEGAVHPNTAGEWAVAFDDSSEFFLVGGELSGVDDLLLEFPDATGPMVGALQTAYLEPTNPFVRDQNDKSITQGQLTITALTLSLSQSSGYIAETTTRYGTFTYTHNGRVMGDENNVIGREPVTDIVDPCVIGHEARQYSVKLRGRSWMPFTITSLEWVGQFFNRTRRV